MRHDPQSVRMLFANLYLRHRSARRLLRQALETPLPDHIIQTRLGIEAETRNALLTTRIALDTNELMYPVGAGFELAKRLGEQRAKRTKLIGLHS